MVGECTNRNLLSVPPKPTKIVGSGLPKKSQAKPHSPEPSLVERTAKNEDSVLLQETLEPHYIHGVGGERLTTKLTTTIRNCHSAT